MDNRRQVYF